MAQAASSVPPPTRAYNMEMQHAEADRSRPDCQGWVFGLPPGIKSQQWPLDPNCGYPLMHGFTVLLPEDYRCHGPDIVALSFFAIACDQNDGGPATSTKIVEVMKAASDTPPSDPELVVFWQSLRNCHPRLHRMKDILDCEYAIILLTRAEFDGPFCQPPRLGINMYLADTEPPKWLEAGGGRAYFGDISPHLDLRLEDYYAYKLLGTIPEPRLDWNRAIDVTPRAQDPNSGKAPEEDYGQGTVSGYQRSYYWEGDVIDQQNYREHEWVKDHKRDHIGGTMQPVQGMPKFSPFYIGFEEYFGGYNFGTGNCQVDFLNMELDWACG